ncbi:MAG: DUF2029 domain-containing protein [Candidatus Lokiarchaeota archaeon]|nr:DUF2029 domain-containing protein [Candidatus Lokiarchaeota archaeon]MBD3202346.1 DUF2029 domain-containing protein [Candidatus Lokiarchaeota archaeon]
MLEKLNFKKNFVILSIPILSLLFWAFIAILKDGFFIDPIDFSAYYYAGRYIFTNPDAVYLVPHPSYFYYLPFIAVLFSPFSLIDIQTAAWLYYVVLLLFGIMSIIEFNRILTLKMDLNPYYKLLSLFIIMGGYQLMVQFDLLNIKIIIMFLIIFFIRREYSQSKHEKYHKNPNWFQFWQIIILCSIIAMNPSLVFIIIIFLFYKVDYKDVIKKEQIKKYLIFLLIFTLQNFMFLIYPSLISDFLNGFSHVKTVDSFDLFISPSYVVEESITFPISFLGSLNLIIQLDTTFLAILSVLIITFITIYLSFFKDYAIDIKLAYFFLFSLFFNVFFKKTFILILIPTLILLLYHFYNFNEDKTQKTFSKNKILLAIGLAMLLILNYLPPIEFLYRTITFFRILPVVVSLFVFTALYSAYTIIIFFLNQKLTHEIKTPHNSLEKG